MHMSQHHPLDAVPHQRDFQALDWANRLDTLGSAVLHYGLVALLLILLGAALWSSGEALRRAASSHSASVLGSSGVR
jgi:hypothetical protein